MNNIAITPHEEDKRGDVLYTTFPNKVTFGGRSFLIPRHFDSDGASVPRLFWRVVFPPTDAKAVTAGICHDYIYRTQPQGWTRKDADRMFLALLIEFGVPLFSAWMAYLAVRWFGGAAWEESAIVLEMLRGAESIDKANSIECRPAQASESKGSEKK